MAHRLPCQVDGRAVRPQALRPACTKALKCSANRPRTVTGTRPKDCCCPCVAHKHNPSPHPFPLPLTTCIRTPVLPWKTCLSTPSKMTMSPPQHPKRALGKMPTEGYVTFAAALIPQIHSYRRLGISPASLFANPPQLWREWGTAPRHQCSCCRPTFFQLHANQVGRALACLIEQHSYLHAR